MFSKYEYVYAIYTEKNFTRAAQKLFISQPSLSAAIKNIEKKVGAPLFERSGGEVTLTQIGEEYIAAAQKIMHIENDFSQAIHDIYNLDTGHITVGGTNYLSSYVLPRVINEFTLRYPKIEVSLVEAHSANLANMIKNEEIDLVIDSFEDLNDIYEGFALLNERILLCVPAQWKINDSLKDMQIHPEDIYNHSINLSEIEAVPMKKFARSSFILLKNGNDMYNRAMRIFEKSGIVPNVKFSVDQLNISYALVESGMGACFATDTLFKFGKFHKDVILYNVEQQHSTRTLYVAYKKKKYCSNAMREFINTAREVLTKNIL